MLAGIVLYNPDVNRLRENIDAILPQVKKLVLVDNGSQNIETVMKKFRGLDAIETISFGRNLGIAAAQNKICAMAKLYNCDWAITLDQDSIVPPNLVEEYKKIINEPDVGMVCPRVVDRNFGEIDDGAKHCGVESVSQCIASASAIRISAWESVGGFYEPLFIDKVDFDICWSLQEHGYKILKTNAVEMLHEVGHGCVKYFWGKNRLILNHSPMRYYYMMRNAFIVGRRHHRLLRDLRMNLRLIYQVNVYETNRFQKNKMILIGLIHGLFGRTGKYGK